MHAENDYGAPVAPPTRVDGAAARLISTCCGLYRALFYSIVSQMNLEFGLCWCMQAPVCPSCSHKVKLRIRNEKEKIGYDRTKWQV
jgi:hypothetical protein